MDNFENQSRKNTFFEWLSNNIQKITIVVVSIVYITQGIFKLTAKEATVLEILGSIGLSVAIGLIISSNLNNMGLASGRRSDIFVASLHRYAEAKKEAVPYLDKLAAWCDYKNSQELESKKRDIIQMGGLNWKGYKFGYYDENLDKLDKDKLKTYYKAKYCKIAKLTSQELLSDLPRKKYLFSRNNKFGESEFEFKNRNIVWDFVSKLGIAIVCGLYSLTPLITEDNAAEILAGVLWNATQIILWLTFGIMKYFNAKSFMEDEYRQTHIILKTEYLNEFIVTIKNNPKVIETYVDDTEINKYIEEFIEKKKVTQNE